MRGLQTLEYKQFRLVLPRFMLFVEKTHCHLSSLPVSCGPVPFPFDLSYRAGEVVLSGDALRIFHLLLPIATLDAL